MLSLYRARKIYSVTRYEFPTDSSLLLIPLLRLVVIEFHVVVVICLFIWGCSNNARSGVHRHVEIAKNKLSILIMASGTV
ncbi:hypothetical protein NDU88_005865 [Pleurodeles waltl]|uniref:Uncharacterized protein n=1 Tax=Pleurodeles waltl TaxID=8319 RepID=A0AAV7L2H7_PLEWA|nr:hypothetical protein NDU88_005865 [Pleurodeles waltl]